MLENRRASTAVSDTSPLIALKHAELLEKLNLLFQKTVIPPSVMQELSIKEKEYFQSLSFISVKEPRDRMLVLTLKTVVDEGEAKAIALSMKKNSLLIIDDLKGRKVARRLGLEIIGTLDLLKAMKLKGIIRKNHS